MFQLFPPLVHSAVTLHSAYLAMAHALLESQLFQDSKPLYDSCCVPFGTCWCVLAQNRCGLRMRIC